MQSKCKRYIISFNGEIYNFRNIKNKYFNKNYKLNTSSDTEILLELISLFGVKQAILMLNGMFAFSIYDKKEKKIYLVRDRLGEKPLHYYFDNNVLIFGSEIKSFVVNGYFKKKIDKDNLRKYFKYGYFTSSSSVFHNLYKVLPGQVLIYSLEKNSIKNIKYWEYKNYYSDINKSTDNLSLNHYSKELEKMLENTLNHQKLADVPVGAFLSGGIDSSLIVAVLSKISSERIKTFTIGFDDKRIDESVFANNIAKYLGTDHINLKLNNTDLINSVEKLTSIYDEPFSDSSQIPTILLSELTKKYVTVSLSGDGGDELFGGYSRYVWAFKIQQMNSIFKYIFSNSINSINDKTLNKLYNFIKFLLPNKFDFKYPEDKLKKISKILSIKDINSIYDRLISVWNEEDNIIKDLNSYNDYSKNINNQNDMMHRDIDSYLPDDLLVKIDRATMSQSLESRAPFLDHEIVEFSASVPLKYKINGSDQKIILKNLLNKYLPESYYERPKMGFEVPIDDWLRGPLRDFTYDTIKNLKNNTNIDLNYIVIDKKLSEHMSGKSNWHYQLWNILIYQKWCENYL